MASDKRQIMSTIVSEAITHENHTAVTGDTILQNDHTIWRETLVVGKFGKLSAKLPLAKYNLVNYYMEHAPCN